MTALDPNRWFSIYFRSIFARSASIVTPSVKSSINTNRKSTTRFPMSPRWTSCVVPKPPKECLKNAKCPKFEQWAAITPKRYKLGCQLLVITVAYVISITLNDLERCNNPYLGPPPLFHVFLPNSISLLARYVTEVEDRPIMSVKFSIYFRSPLLAITNPPCSAVFLRQPSYL